MKAISRRELLHRTGLALGGGLLASAAAMATRSSGRPPNFVVIFVDDMGYGDLGCYGAEQIKTPRLDQMAAEGIRFTDFYCCAPVCTPSRAGLMTGRYPIRSGLTRVLFPNSKSGIDDSEITIAQVLQEQGYATACFGKWHLGHHPENLPTRHGFDYYYGVPYSNDMEVKRRGDPPLPLMRNEEIAEQPANQDTLTKRYTEEAIGFIRQHKHRPFFVYLPHTMVHIPLHVSDDFRDTSARGLYGDAVEEIDWSTGAILDEIKALDLDEDTLVCFTSDNGPWLVMEENGGSAGPLRDGKGTTFEGGMRMPCIARWPGSITPGRVEHAPASTLDFLPTFAALAGGTAPKDRVIDGKDITGVFLGTGSRADEEFFYYHGQELRAYRSGKWKLKRPFKGKVYGRALQHPTLLYDIVRDPGETTNLASQYPQVVARMEQAMDAFHGGLGEVPPPKR